MSVIQSTFHSLKHDNRLFYAMVAGWAVGGLVNSLAMVRVEKADQRDEMGPTTRMQRIFSAIGGFCAYKAYSNQSSKWGAVSALGFCGSFWSLYQISTTNSQRSTSYRQQKVDRAIKMSFLGLVGIIAVPVSVFAWHAAQSFIKKA